jgi:hypothetical protein
MPGRNTFTATSRPSAVRAKWTWAMDAAAIAVGSNEEKRASNRHPNSVSIKACVSLPGKGGNRSCRLAKSIASSSPSKSARVDRSCPSLTKLGPNSSNAVARRWPGRDPSRSLRRAKRWLNRTNPPAAGTARSGDSASCRARIRQIRIRRTKLRRLRRSPKPGRGRSKAPG